MFGVTLVSIIVASLSVLVLKVFPRYMLWLVLLLCCIFCSLASLYFLAAIWTLVPNFPEQVLWFNLDYWKDSNPIYGRMLVREATVVCILFGLVFLGLAIGFAYK